MSESFIHRFVLLLKGKIPKREEIVEHKFLGFLTPYFAAHDLWHLSRRGVAMGAAIGVFFAFIIPTPQILFAVIFAIILRGNIPVAALSTLVSNPFTFAPIYLSAYKLGVWLLDEKFQHLAIKAIKKHSRISLDFSNFDNFFHSFFSLLHNMGTPLILGLFIFAVIGSLFTYFFISYAWIYIVRNKRKDTTNKRKGKIIRISEKV